MGGRFLFVNMKAIKHYPKPTYITVDASGYFTCQDKKDRFRLRYTYLFKGHLIDIVAQSNGKELEDESYFERLLN